MLSPYSLLFVLLCSSLCVAQVEDDIVNFLRSDLANGLLGFDVFEDFANELIVTPKGIDGGADITKVSTALGNVVRPYIQAIGTIVRNIELRFGDPRGLDPSTAEVLVLATELEGVVGLEFSERLNTMINETIAPVKYAPNINLTDSDFLLGAFASGAAVQNMVANWNNFPNLKYQYFASESGFTRVYPAFAWPEEYLGYDARLQSWYANAASGPKTIVLMIRKGHNYGGAVSAFLDTFSEKDFVQIVEYGNNSTGIPDCFSVVPSQLFRTSAINVAEFKKFAQASQLKVGGESNAEDGFRAAFQTHGNTIENPTYPTCLPKIIWLPGPEEEQDNDLRVSVSKMNKEFEATYGRPMVISVYQLAKYNQFAHRIACETVGGEYQGNIVIDDLRFILARHYLLTAQSIRTAAESSQFVESAQFTFRHSSFLTTTFRPDGAELTPRIIFSIVQPVYTGRRFIGTVGLEFEMFEFEQALESEVVGATGVYILSDQQGSAIVHPNVPSVNAVMPTQLTDLRLVEVTPAFFSVRTGMVDGVAGFRQPIAMIRRNDEFQQTVLTSRYDWDPVTDTPLSVAIGRSSAENALADLEVAGEVDDLFFVSAFVPSLDPAITDPLNLVFDPTTGTMVSFDFATYNLPSGLYFSREQTFDTGSISNIHNYLNNAPGVTNNELKREAKDSSRIFSASGLTNFWRGTLNAGITDRSFVFALGESAVYPGRTGGPFSDDLRLRDWYKRAIDFLPSPVPDTFATAPTITLGTPIRKDANNVVNTLSLAAVVGTTPVAVMSMEMTVQFFWENFVAASNGVCKLTGNAAGSHFCVLLDPRGLVVSDMQQYAAAQAGTSEFLEPVFIGSAYPPVAKLLADSRLLVNETRVSFGVDSTTTSKFFLDRVLLGTFANDMFTGDLSGMSCAQASEVVLKMVPNTNLLILTLSSDFAQSGCEELSLLPVEPFVVEACEEATFAYRSPTETENCPFPLFFTDESLDPFREDNFTCGDLEEFFIIDWIRWDDGIAIAMVSLTAVTQFMVLLLMVWVWMNQDSAVIRMASPIFCELVLLGSIIALSTVYFLTGEPTENICRSRAWFFCIGFSMTFGALFAKTWRLHKIHRMARDFKNKPITMTQLLGLLFGAMSPTIFLLVLWSAIDTLGPEDIKDDINDDKQIRQCQSDNQWVWQGLLIAVNAILVLYGCYVSIVTRKIRLSFNESRYIALAIYTVALMAPIGIAIGSALENNMIAWYAILCATIIAGTFLCVFVLFVSKLRIHYFKPEKNTLTTSSGSATGTGGTVDTL